MKQIFFTEVISDELDNLVRYVVLLSIIAFSFASAHRAVATVHNCLFDA